MSTRTVLLFWTPWSTQHILVKGTRSTRVWSYIRPTNFGHLLKILSVLATTLYILYSSYQLIRSFIRDLVVPQVFNQTWYLQDSYTIKLIHVDKCTYKDMYFKIAFLCTLAQYLIDWTTENPSGFILIPFSRLRQAIVAAVHDFVFREVQVPHI